MKKSTWIPAGTILLALLSITCETGSVPKDGPAFTVINRSDYVLELRLGENEFGEVFGPLTDLDTPLTAYPDKTDVDDWDGDGDKTNLVKYKVDHVDFRILARIEPHTTQKVTLQSGAAEDPLIVSPVWSTTVVKYIGPALQENVFKLSFVSTVGGANDKTVIKPTSSGENIYVFPRETVTLNAAFAKPNIKIPYALVQLINNNPTEAAALVSGPQRTRAVSYSTVDDKANVPVGKSAWYEVPYAEALPYAFLQTTSYAYDSAEGIALCERAGITNPGTGSFTETSLTQNVNRTGRIRLNLQIGIVPGLNGGYEMLTGVRDPTLFTMTADEVVQEAQSPGIWFPTGRPIPYLERGGVYIVSYDMKPSGSSFNSTTYKPALIDTGIRLTAADF
ncbi:hypothetical protein AGMMS49991_06470 [Spirochaetia bacterium]|nr:hypothetical protein AGMMS49991_06470 [Spirochaetia bacterium]